MVKLSVIIIARDASQTIQKTLASVTFAEETIVVVDSRTSDSTADIAKQMDAKVYLESWQGYGPQKNLALTLAANDWVLFVDADEEVSSELKREIEETLKNPTSNIYWLPIITIFLNKPLKHLAGYNPRLFKKISAQWSNAHVHEQLETTNDRTPIKLGDINSAILASPLLHYSYQNIADYLKKMHVYTSLDAKQMLLTSHHRSGRPVTASFWLPFWLYLRQLIKMLFYKRGLLDGRAGIVWSGLSAYYEYEMGRKYLKLISIN